MVSEYSRRDLLHACSAGTLVALTGCARFQADSPSSNADESLPSTTKRADTCPDADRRVSISETASAPDGANVSTEVTLENGCVTSSSPARLTVLLKNTGEARGTKISDTEYCHVFNRHQGVSSPRGIHLYRTANTPQRKGEKWTEDESPSDTRTYVSIGCGNHTFEAGETIATTYELWDDYAEEEYFPTGTFRFERTIQLSESGTPGDPGETVAEFDWWFEVEVTEPNI